jgi:hypothetical protein
MRITNALVATAAAGLVGLGGIAALPAVAGASPAPARAAAPAYGVWPGQVDGQPSTLKAGAPTGYYVWHTSTGWHLEVTHPTKTDVVFSGTVTADGALKYQRVGLEKNDITRLGPKDHTLSFAFNNHGELDGVHFTTDKTTTLTFTLDIDGHKAGTAQVSLGAKALHPDRVPFSVDRTGIH